MRQNRGRKSEKANADRTGTSWTKAERSEMVENDLLLCFFERHMDFIYRPSHS